MKVISTLLNKEMYQYLSVIKEFIKEKKAISRSGCDKENIEALARGDDTAEVPDNELEMSSTAVFITCLDEIYSKVILVVFAVGDKPMIPVKDFKFVLEQLLKYFVSCGDVTLYPEYLLEYATVKSSRDFYIRHGGKNEKIEAFLEQFREITGGEI